MEMIDVESSNLAKVGYNRDEERLVVVFKKSGDVYEYYDVPEYVYEELMNVDSHGVYFGKNIRTSYRYSRIG